MSEYKLVHNAETGEISQVPLTPEEIEQNLKDAENARILKEQFLEAQAKKEVAKAKLAALGITTDDLKALGL
jgi:hypothetical protein